MLDVGFWGAWKKSGINPNRDCIDSSSCERSSLDVILCSLFFKAQQIIVWSALHTAPKLLSSLQFDFDWQSPTIPFLFVHLLPISENNYTLIFIIVYFKLYKY